MRQRADHHGLFVFLLLMYKEFLIRTISIIIYFIIVPNQTDANQNAMKNELKNDRKRFDFRYPYSIVLLYFSPPSDQFVCL